MVHRIVKTIHFCYGHRLLEYQGRCAHPHGHNGTLEVELAATELDRSGMVFDFSEVKRQLTEYIDAKLDHRMLLRHDDPLVAALHAIGEPVFVMDENPTAENIAKLIYSIARQKGLPVTAVRLWETHDAFAEYRGPEPQARG